MFHKGVAAEYPGQFERTNLEWSRSPSGHLSNAQAFSAYTYTHMYTIRVVYIYYAETACDPMMVIYILRILLQKLFYVHCASILEWSRSHSRSPSGRLSNDGYFMNESTYILVKLFQKLF